MDWSLKTKVTMISKFNFDWTDLKPNEDVQVYENLFNQGQLHDSVGVQFHILLYRWSFSFQLPHSFTLQTTKLIIKERSRIKLTDHEVTDLHYFKEKEQNWFFDYLIVGKLHSSLHIEWSEWENVMILCM